MHLRELLRRFANAFRRTRPDPEVESELQFHLQMEIESGSRLGLSKDEAARQAVLRAGSVSAALEDMREQRSFPWIEGTLADLRHAAVALARHRGFALTAITALALTVALNTLIFTLLDGVILRPLPYPQPDRLVRLFEDTPRNPKWPLSIGNFQEIRRNSQSFESVALYTRQDLQLMHGERAERLPSVRISPEFFSTLGVAPMLGRNFNEADTLGSLGQQTVVILSNGLWRTRFQQDPDIVGKTLRINQQNWTVIGVLPPGFQHVGGSFRSPLQGETVALWWPLQLDLKEPQQRSWHFTNAVARLKPGASLQQARDDIAHLAAALRNRYPNYNRNVDIRVFPLSDEVVGGSRRTVWLLAAAGAIVLLISCANVAGLCIARSLARRKEIAVRKALGAGAGRLVREVLCENLLLGICGGVVGLALATILAPLWKGLLPADFPRIHEVYWTWGAALFSIACAVGTSLIAGVAPALRQASFDPSSSLSRESRSSTAGREATRLRAGLVAAEVAFAAALCASAALLVQSSQRLNARPHGFDSNGVLTFTMALPRSAFTQPGEAGRLYDRVINTWKRLPGVQVAAMGGDVPWTGYNENSSFGVPGTLAENTSGTQARFHMASRGYFEALRIPLRAGRTFDERDTDTSPPVVVVNETLVRKYLADQNPIGRVLDIWGAKRTVIGVVSDVFDWPADLQAEPAFWFPMTQMPVGQAVAVLRTSLDPLSILPAVREALRELDREIPVAEVRTMDEVAARALGERNLAKWMFQAFAAMALMMAVFGIYGLLSYEVEQRCKEFGIRMALGATRGNIVNLVLKRGLLLAAIGGVAGLLLSPLAERSLRSLLYGVALSDPVSLVAPVLILAVSAAASLIPALLATRAAVASTLRTG